MGSERPPRRQAEKKPRSRVRVWVESAREHWLALLLWAGCAVTLARTLHGPRGIEGLLALRAELDAARQKDGELLQQSAELREALDRLRRDRSGTELAGLARSRLRLARPGETVYLIERTALARDGSSRPRLPIPLAPRRGR